VNLKGIEKVVVITYFKMLSWDCVRRIRNGN
jgi:hypothetical protein